MSSDIEYDLDDEFEWVDADVISDIEEMESSSDRTLDTKAISNEVAQKTDRKKDIQLYKFIAAISQIEHNFYSKDFSPHDLPFLSERISGNVKIAKKIADAFDYDVTNLTHIYYFNILLKQVSFLSSAATHLGTRIEDSLEDKDYINKIKEVNVDGVVVLEGELATNEVSMHIKSVLVPYCIYFESSLSKAFSGISLNTYLDIVIEITKTLATKWNKGININKRHLLFVSALDTVSRFVLNRTVQSVGELVKKKMSENQMGTSTIWDRIEQYHLGLNDFPNEKDILIEKVDSLINAEINDFYMEKRTFSVLVSKERARLWLISSLGNTWLEFHDSVISKLQVMSKEDRQAYFAKTKNMPELTLFLESLSSDCKSKLNEIQKINMEENELRKSIKKEFSSLWGVSDAYCKISS